MIGNLNITWIDNNHATIQDPEFGRKFSVTVRPKTNRFVAGRTVKPRLYVSGLAVDAAERRDDLSFNQRVKVVKEYFLPTLQKLLNRNVDIRFSQKAGCSCGCSPGFIVEDKDFLPSNDFWMDDKGLES